MRRRLAVRPAAALGLAALAAAACAPPAAAPGIDVWRFDGATEAWTEVETTDPPPGRRAPFFALAPDGDTFVFGDGSDYVLQDAWILEPPDALAGAWR